MMKNLLMKELNFELAMNNKEISALYQKSSSFQNVSHAAVSFSQKN
jgi:hypothetical protein